MEIESRSELEEDRAALYRKHELVLAELASLRRRVTRQRRELRRLNKEHGPWWAGFSVGLSREAENRLRGIMNKAFGHEKVREAELAAVP